MLLCAITDRRLLPGDEDQRRTSLLALARGWASGGVDFIQIREKDLDPERLLLLARELVNAVRDEPGQDGKRGTRILLNGAAAVAVEAGADGVHLPGNAPVGAAVEAREFFARAGRRTVISRACHSASEVAAVGSDADLVIYAPVFEKALPGEAILGQGLTALAEACRAAESIPVLALGGVTVGNADGCVAAGAAGVAAIRLFFGVEWRGLRSL
jgi:thiamine-phosphate pyrophosphorylase